VSRLLIVGGSDAGISASLRAREVDPNIGPLLIVAADSIRGLP
jgi:hypothetical protein